MNVNLLQPSTPWPSDDNLWAKVQDNADAIGRSGEFPLTGQVILMSEPVALMGGVFQVWHQTIRDTWVYVTPDGVQLETDCPPGHPQVR